MPQPIPFFDGTNPADVQRLAASVEQAFAQAAPTTEAAAIADRTGPIGKVTTLIGIDERIIDQINAALRAEKRHLMFYGPPGTGKTTLAEYVASALADPNADEQWKLITGSSDWSSQDIIGGYQPMGGGTIEFMKGVLLEHFDKPLIIDELNRCDIDKVIGPLFTVLSGQATTLPYLSKAGDKASPRITILPKMRPNLEDHQFAPTERWRLIATINSIDKASLYQMSYALTRRFAWILVDVPNDLPGFVWAYLKSKDWLFDAAYTPKEPTPLSTVWEVVNTIRKVGPAPIIDIIKFVRAMVADGTQQTTPIVADDPRTIAFLDGFYTFLLPMLDGIRQDQADDLTMKMIEIFQLPQGSALARQLTERLKDAAV